MIRLMEYPLVHASLSVGNSAFGSDTLETVTEDNMVFWRPDKFGRPTDGAGITDGLSPDGAELTDRLPLWFPPPFPYEPSKQQTVSLQYESAADAVLSVVYTIYNIIYRDIILKKSI